MRWDGSLSRMRYRAPYGANNDAHDHHDHHENDDDDEDEENC